MKYWKKKVVLFGLETVYGQDAAPDATKAIQALELSITPLEAQDVQQESATPWMGAGESSLVGLQVKLDFTVNLAGSGLAGTPPAYGPVIKACAMREIIVAGTSVQYLPVSSGFDSATIYVNIDGTLHKVLGARGSFTTSIQGSAIPSIKFSFIGLFGGVASVTLPTASYDTFIKPVIPSKNVTPETSIYAKQVSLKSASFSNGANPSFITRVNSESIQITDHPATSDWVIDDLDLSILDPFSAAANGTKGALKIVHGTVAGNIVILSAPAAQMGKPQKANDSGLVVMTLPFSLKPMAGDDEFSITFK